MTDIRSNSSRSFSFSGKIFIFSIKKITLFTNNLKNNKILLRIYKNKAKQHKHRTLCASKYIMLVLGRCCAWKNVPSAIFWWYGFYIGLWVTITLKDKSVVTLSKIMPLNSVLVNLNLLFSLVSYSIFFNSVKTVVILNVPKSNCS